MIILVGDPSPLFSLLFILSSIGDWCDAYLLYLFPNKPNKGEIFTNIGVHPPYSLFLFNPPTKDILLFVHFVLMDFLIFFLSSECVF